jgi:membrane protein EpsK
VVTIGLIVLQIPFYAWCIWKLDWIIDFPLDLTGDFRTLVICNVIIFFSSLIIGVFRTPIQASNRLDISSSLESLRLGLRMLLLYILIKWGGAKLWIIGFVDLTLALVFGGFIYSIYRKLAPELVFKFRYVTRKWIRPVANMAGWSIVMALGAGLFVKTDVWMINRFVNKEMAGIYAALLIWPNFLKQISKQLALVLTPVYLIDYAKGDTKRIANLSFFAAKFLGCFTGLMAGFLCIVAVPLLDLWLGSWATEYATLLRVMTIYVTFTIGEAVLWQIYVTMNQVHYTGIVTLLAGIVNIISSLLLIRFGFGTLGVAIGTILSSVLACSIAIPLGVCRLLNISHMLVWKSHLSAAIMLLLSLGITHVALLLGRSASVMAGVVLFAVLMFAGVYAVGKVVFSTKEINYIYRLLDDVLLRLSLMKQNSR